MTSKQNDDTHRGPVVVRPLLRTVCTVLALILVVAGARVRTTFSDPRVTLLSAQALLETGSPRLDPYLSSEVLERESIPSWALWRLRGSTYNVYPPGASVLAIPAVALARQLGLDMVRSADDALLQVVLAALLVAGVFVVLERTARLLLPPGIAWVVAVVFVLGTSITSTLGSGLWSHGPTVLLGALAMHRLCLASVGARPASGALLGLLLGGAFWCRPTAALPGLLVAVLLSVRSRREALRFALASGGMVLALVGVSIVFFGQPLPSYYLPSRWPASPAPWVGLAGVLVSPGRGLFFFSPVLLIGLAGWWSAELRRDPLYRLATAWSALQALLVARNLDWWGGWCFGPRLLSDSLPAWFVLVVMSIAWLRRMAAPRPRRWLAGAVIAGAAVFSAAVHVVQGLYNPATWYWNDRPNVYDAPVDKLFDLSNPQFLATWRRNDAAAARWATAASTSPLADDLRR